MTDYTVADTLHIAFSTRAFATGIPTVLAGTPVVSAYEDAGLTQITAGITLGVSHDGVVGLNMLTIVATGANGYESGKDYNLVITTGTVGGVSVVGEVVGQFTLGRSAAAVDLANGTDGLGAIKTDTAAILVDTADIQPKLGAPAGASISADIAVIEAQTDDIGVAGVGLTAINLPNQTMDIVGNITGNLSGSVGSVTGSVGSVVGHTNQTGDNFVRLGAPAGANVSADIAAVKVDTDKIPEGVDKNTALSNFEFVMYDSTDHITPKTGLTVTGTRSIDGGAFGAVSGTFAEIGNGVYQFDALAADTNGDLITWRFAAATADDTFFTFKTS